MSRPPGGPRLAGEPPTSGRSGGPPSRERGLHALDRRPDRLALSSVRLPVQGGVRRPRDRFTLLGERAEGGPEPRLPAELGEHRLERDPCLERGFAWPPRVEV